MEMSGCIWNLGFWNEDTLNKKTTTQSGFFLFMTLVC